ncbi:MAG TPA: hypothetical protein H9948_08820 [Candidatus Jeotgalibaca merdavium]|uniref:Uncharacterized protein n=1 Tax=Candidatus Jeotgalibaca merdavium TaxID=2838627 RepID=A0A9D2I085_9LACT|nr:hypothetical protein [Candidatus Jeotgalibaca merdavium]
MFKLDDKVQVSDKKAYLFNAKGKVVGLKNDEVLVDFSNIRSLFKDNQLQKIKEDVKNVKRNCINE